MPRSRRHTQLLDLAKRGAEARLRELTQEINYLIDLFPDVRDTFDRDELPLPFIIARSSMRHWRKKTKRGRKAASKA